MAQNYIRMVILFMTTLLVLIYARSNHFDGANQLPETDTINSDVGLNEVQWNFFKKLAQLAQMNRDEYEQRAWDRGIRSPENKRQSRYRQCYFNPISCFRK